MSRLEEVAMMKRKITLAVLFILITSLLLSAAAPAYNLVELTVRNNTHNTVYIKLEGKSFYYLTVKYDEKVFTIKTGTYKATLWGCGSKKTIRKLVISKNLRLVFPTCNAKKRSTESKVLRIQFPSKKK
jgi:hypothetical protein